MSASYVNSTSSCSSGTHRPCLERAPWYIAHSHYQSPHLTFFHILEAARLYVQLGVVRCPFLPNLYVTLVWNNARHLLTLSDFYHVTFPQDRKVVKSMVYVIYVFELVQTVIITRDAFITFAQGFGDDSQLSSSHMEWFATPILSGIGALSTVNM